MLPNNRLEVHFLNVDHGDCTIVRHPGDEHRSKGRVSFVDIHDWKARKTEDRESVAGLSDWLRSQLSGGDDRTIKNQITDEEYAREYLNDPIDYFQSEVDEGDQDVWRFIATHPDMDHLSGLNRLKEEVGISGMWDTAHNRTLDESDFEGAPFEFEDWKTYTEIRSGDTDEFYIQPTEGDKGNYWEEDNIDILHPNPEAVQELNEANADTENPNYNDYSFILKINTRAGGVLLPGDAETEVLDRIYDEHREKLEDVVVLKAPHHGRRSSFHRDAVECMDPEYVVLSVGKKPSTDAHSYYNDACSNAEVLSTRQYGRIKFTISRGNVIRAKEYPDGIFDLPGE